MQKNNIAVFIFGCVVGSAATYIYLNRNKCEEQAVVEDNDRETANDEEDICVEDYKSHLKHYRCDEKGDESEVVKPYIISPEEFGENDDYELICMTYYNDKVLADDDDNVVNDIEDTVGIEALSHFGEYEDDSVFVRNDILRCDYEILLDPREYSDVLREMPYKNK